MVFRPNQINDYSIFKRLLKQLRAHKSQQGVYQIKECSEKEGGSESSEHRHQDGDRSTLGF